MLTHHLAISQLANNVSGQQNENRAIGNGIGMVAEKPADDGNIFEPGY
jgi:hypothetical protein